MKLSDWLYMWNKTGIYHLASPNKLKRLQLSIKHNKREVFLEDIYRSTRGNSLIIDVGAFDGDSTIYLREFNPDAEILAFEPSDAYYKIPKIHNAKILKAAAGAKDGYCDLEGNNVTTKTKANRNGKVPMLRLSKLITRDCFLKMDCEGAEFEIWEDLIKTKKIRYVDEFVCEFHVKDREANFGKCLAELEKRYLLHYRADMCPLAQSHTQQDILVHGIRK